MKMVSLFRCTLWKALKRWFVQDGEAQYRNTNLYIIQGGVSVVPISF